MGKPPADEKEQLRQLTRELHEAAQHAKEGAAALRAAWRETGADVEAMLRRLVEVAEERLQTHFDIRNKDMEHQIAGWLAKAETDIAAHLGAASRDDLANGLVERLYKLVIPELNNMIKEVQRQGWDAEVMPAAGHFGQIVTLDRATYARMLKDGTVPKSDITIIDS
jgi:uncharacterized membrane protein